MMIKLNVGHTGITVLSSEKLVVGNVNSLHIKFFFTPEWDGLTRTAVFTNGGTARSVILSTDSCPIPWEVLSSAGKLFVSVRGTDDDGEYRLCTEDEFIGHVLDSSAADPAALTGDSVPDALDVLLAELSSILDGIQILIGGDD